MRILTPPDAETPTRKERLRTVVLGILIMIPVLFVYHTFFNDRIAMLKEDFAGKTNDYVESEIGNPESVSGSRGTGERAKDEVVYTYHYDDLDVDFNIDWKCLNVRLPD